MKRFLVMGLSVILCGCSQNINTETNNEIIVTNTNNEFDEAYSIIHDGIESLDALSSYSYTMTNLYYVPTIETSIQIKTDQYKIKNEDNGYSGVSLSETYYYDLSFSQKEYDTISTSSFKNEDNNQQVTNILDNGKACNNACTSTLSSDNENHRSLLSPKENLYDVILGEKTGFLKNIYLKTYEESSQLKETYKTKKNYLQSFIDTKQTTWKDLTIENDINKKVITYTVTIDLGIDYLNSILNNLEDENSIQYVQNQIDGNEPYVEKITRKDQITIDSKGVLSTRKQTYSIFCSNEKTKVLSFNDKIDTNKVTDFSFDDITSKLQNNNTLQLAGTYIYSDDNGNSRILVFNNQSVTIEESNSVQTGTYSINNTELRINITNEDGNLESTELFTISNKDGTLTDSKGNTYYYYSNNEYNASQTTEENNTSDNTINESTEKETESFE